MKLELTPAEKDVVISAVKQVLEGGDDWDAPNFHYPAGALIKAVLEIDGVESVDRDSNGWQWDWWNYFTYEGKRFTLSGSGYYGGHAFYLSDEQEVAGA